MKSTGVLKLNQSFIRMLMTVLSAFLVLLSSAYADEKSEFVGVPIYFATDRVKSEESGATEFGYEQSEQLTFGMIDVAVPTSRPLLELPSPSIWRLEIRPDPAKHVVATSTNLFENVKDFTDSIEKTTEGLERSEIFLFVPGYNVTLEDAVRRAATFAVDFQIKGAVVVYSWPSAGKLLSYTRDEVTVERSAANFAKFIEMLTTKVDVDQFELLTHSLGVRLVGPALTLLNSNRVIFDDVIFAAPDMDVKLFERSYSNQILNSIQSAALLYSPGDRAIMAAEQLRGDLNRSRFGELNLEKLDYYLVPEQSSSDFLGSTITNYSSHYIIQLRRSLLLFRRGFVERAIEQTAECFKRFLEDQGADHYLTQIALLQYVKLVGELPEDMEFDRPLSNTKVQEVLRDGMSSVLTSLDGATVQVNNNSPINPLNSARRLIGILLAGQGGVFDASQVFNDAFGLSQHLRKSSAADSLKAALARLSYSDVRIDDLIRESDSISANLQDQETVLAVEKSRPPNERDSRRETRLEQKRDEYRVRLFEINQELEAIDIKLPELSNTRAMSAEETQSYLSAEEAMIYYFFSEDNKLVAFVVSRSGIEVVPLEGARHYLSQTVKSLRDQLDIRGAEFASQLPRYDVAKSLALYKMVFEPLEDSLFNIKRILIVTSGPLDSIPFHTLVSKVGVSETSDWPTVYSGSTWLSDRFSIAHLPTATSLRFLKTEISDVGAKPYPLLGFADPTMRNRFGSKTVTDDSEFRVVSKAEEKFQTKLITLGGKGSFDALAPVPQTRELLLAVGKRGCSKSRSFFW